MGIKSHPVKMGQPIKKYIISQIFFTLTTNYTVVHQRSIYTLKNQQRILLSRKKYIFFKLFELYHVTVPLITYFCHNVGLMLY
jgi:hypothetical protein